MATGDSYWRKYNAYRKNCNSMEMFRSMLGRIGSEVNLSSVRSCSTFGPGEGLYETAFIQRCAPNVDQLIAIEQDHESAERLKARLGDSLPNVDCIVVETDFYSWKGLDDPVDLVLLFHVLYDICPSERKQFVKKVHSHWLNSGGFAAVVSASHTKSPGSSYKIGERLGKPVVPWEDIEADFLEIGFVKKHAYEMQFARYFSNSDESYLRFYQSRVNNAVTLDDIRNTINELFPSGKTDQCFTTLAVFQRTH